MQVTGRLQEGEDNGLYEVEEDDEFEADELLEGSHGLEFSLEASVEAEDGGDG